MKNQISFLLVVLFAFCSWSASAQITLEGTITRFDGEEVENVPILLNGSISDVTFTNEDGIYSFEVPEDGTYTITPVSDEQYLNGVSSLDVAMIQQHLSGDNLFDNPFQLIAADVNNSQSITVTDATEIGQLITSTILEFPNSPSWRFFDASFVITDPDNPWGTTMPEVITVSPTSDILDLDFTAVKIGDVNNTNLGSLGLEPCELSCGFVNGTVYYDENLNCTFDPLETPLKNWTLQFESSNDIYTVSTNQVGSFQIAVIPGDYTVTLTVPNGLWEPCVLSQDITVEEEEEVTIDFGAQAVKACPAMSVDLGTPFLRPCFDNGFYWLEYCNQGTTVAEDAYLEVTFNSELTILASEPEWDEQDGNLFTFQLGDLDFNECGLIAFQVFTDCEVEIGQALCSEAYIYPDSLCLDPSPLWDGSDLRMTAYCDGDSVRFDVVNEGVKMANTTNFFVVEDDMIMMHPDNQIQLGKDEVRSFAYPANGSTWRFNVDQAIDNPYSTYISRAIEACVDNTGEEFSMGFLNMFPLNPDDPWHDIDCPEAIAAYDPNDKQAIPRGVGEEHFIEPGTELEYTIRFQNTGNDTAFNVRILDTLQTETLDILSLRPGVSSHPYQFNIIGENVLEFMFADIMLPDSNVNEPLSHGFVKFRVQQQPDLELGTVIENDAAIYFDFQDPIITNTAFHTLGEDFLEVVNFITQTPETNIQLQVYPNPVSGQSSIYLAGDQIENGQFLMIDVLGRQVFQTQFQNNEIDLQSGAFSAGMYLFEIYDGNQKVGSGKLMVR